MAHELKVKCGCFMCKYIDLIVMHKHKYIGDEVFGAMNA